MQESKFQHEQFLAIISIKKLGMCSKDTKNANYSTDNPDKISKMAKFIKDNKY